MGWQDDAVLTPATSAPSARAPKPAWANDPVVSAPSAPSASVETEASYAKPMGVTLPVPSAPSAPSTTGGGVDWAQAGTRFITNAVSAVRNSLQGATWDYLDRINQDQIVKNLREQGQNEAADRYLADRGRFNAAETQKEAAAPGWNQGSFGNRVVQGAAGLGGILTGGLGSPENLVGAGAAGAAEPLAAQTVRQAVTQVAKRTAKAGLIQAGVSVATNPVVQALQIGAETRKEYDPVETAMAGLMGFGIGAGLHGAGEVPGLVRDTAQLFRDWRAGRAVKADAAVPEGPPTPQEMQEFAASPEMQAHMAANNIAPTSPLAAVLQERLPIIRQAEAVRAQQPSHLDMYPPAAEPGSAEWDAAAQAQRNQLPPQFYRKDELQPQPEPAPELSPYGATVDQDATNPAFFLPQQQRPAVPDIIPVDPYGRADVGAAGPAAGVDKFGAPVKNLPMVVGQPPIPPPMGAEEIARSQAKMFGGRQSAAEPPPRLIAPEDRLPQTPEQMQMERRAASAFQLAEQQQKAAGTRVRDTQAAGRPEGAAMRTVVLDQNHPVRVVDRFTVEVKGKPVQMARVHRYDPRTDEKLAEEYDVPADTLTKGNYALEPRRAQEFERRAQGPLVTKGKMRGQRFTPEQPRMPDQEIQREPRQTYRADAARDENTQFPGAGEGRSPFPEQPEGPHPGRQQSTWEDVARRFEEQRARGEDYKPKDEGPRKTDNKASNTPKGLDADGRWHVDDRGFVLSNKGGPLKFAEAKQAAKWIVTKGHKESLDQIFDPAIHPSGNGYAVYERGRAEPQPKPKEPSPDGAGGGAKEGEVRPTGQLPPPAPKAEPAPKPEPKPEAPKAEAGPSDFPPDVAAREDAQRGLDVAREDVAAVRGQRPKAPTGGKSIGNAVRDEGGIRTRNKVTGELTPEGEVIERILQDRKGGGGIINNQTGMRPENMLERLGETGWFPQSDGKPGMRELYDKLTDDMAGDRQYHPSEPRYQPDTEVRQRYEAHQELRDQADRAGITEADSPEEAAQKLVDYRAKVDREAQATEADRAAPIDDSVHAGLTPDELEDLYSDGYRYEPASQEGGYEPGADHGAESEGDGERPAGAGAQEPARDENNDGAANDLAAGKASAGAGNREAGTVDRGTDEHPSGARREAAAGPEGQADKPDLNEAARQKRRDDVFAAAKKENPDLTRAEFDRTVEQARSMFSDTRKPTEPEQTRVPGTEEATPEELRAREAKRTVEEKQANPRAYKDKPQKPADEGLFTDQSEKAQTDMFKDEPGAKDKAETVKTTRTKFYSNPVGDPEIWKDVGRDMSGAFGWAKKEAASWSREWQHSMASFGEKPPINELGVMGKWHDTRPMREWITKLWYTNDGQLRTLAARYKSEAMRIIADHFYAAPRVEAGAVKEDFFQGINRNRTRWLNEIADVLEPFHKMDEAEQQAALKQIGAQVQSPASIRRGTPMGDAAASIGKVLKEVHTYLKEAGVELGEIKGGYLPRVENTQAILRDPDGFLTAATKAYMADGIPRLDAKKAAQNWLDRVRLGDWGVSTEGSEFGHMGAGTANSFTRSRSLSKKADTIMGDFFLRNPADIMPAYVGRAVHSAEWSRRFGVRDPGAVVPKGEDAAKWKADPEGKWKDIRQSLIDEGNAHLIPEAVKHIRSITGNWGSVTGASGASKGAMSLARTWSALSYLPRSVFASLSEPVNIAIRTGNTLDAMTAYGETLRQWLPVVNKAAGAKYLHGLASDLGFVGEAIDDLTMLQRIGGENGGLLARKIQSKFFRANGLTQLTEANRIASVKIGMTFMRRLATDISEKSAYQNIARRLMAELGVGADHAEDFAKYVVSLDKPTAAQLKGGGKHGEAYQVALSRFVNQTVMHPTGALKPYYAQHPLGSLIWNLQSFNLAFQKNVLNRIAASTKLALTPGSKSGLSAQERMYAAMPLVNTLPLLGATWAVSAVRDYLFQDPARKGQPPMTGKQTAQRVLSRAGLTGSWDMAFNAFTGARYQHDPLTGALGPVLGGWDTQLGNVMDTLSDRNSPNTNTQERKLAASTYNMVVAPAMEAGVLSVVPQANIFNKLLTTATVYGLAHPGTRELLVRKLAGPPAPK